MRLTVPSAVISSLTGRETPGTVEVLETDLAGGTGAATLGLARLTILVHHEADGPEEFRVVRKEFRPLSSGPHKHGAEDPGHWAYWKRELLAYSSSVLPAGPGLRAPRCHGAFGTTVYLEDAGTGPADPGRAARHLGAWQLAAAAPAVPWLSGHQLAQRVDASDLDWSAVDADPRAALLWNARHHLLERLARVPHVLSHGDFHLGNLRTVETDTVALDWGTLGSAPVGSDLAYLALSTHLDPLDDYLAAAGDSVAEEAVVEGYRTTLALVGASRVHWMLSRRMDIPDGYVDFIWANRPNLPPA